VAVRLEHIVEEFQEAVEVTWRSFLLRPTPAPRSLERFRAYTETWLRPASQAGGGRFRVWSSDEPPPSHSVPPQVALKAAARQGGFDRYHRAVMDAYFWDNRNVSAAATLVEIAAGLGLEPATFERDLRDPALEREVLRDYNEAIERGIAAVPTVLVDDEWQIPGSQDLAFYRRVIERRLSRARGEGG
jgi:predicted DsbA family dithiol-disulfide isomerase